MTAESTIIWNISNLIFCQVGRTVGQFSVQGQSLAFGRTGDVWPSWTDNPVGDPVHKEALSLGHAPLDGQQLLYRSIPLVDRLIGVSGCCSIRIRDRNSSEAVTRNVA